MESLGIWTSSPPLPFLLPDQTQPGFFSREKEEAGNKVWSPWALGELPHPSPPYCVTRLNQGLFSRAKEEAGNKVWSPWASGQLPHASPSCCMTRFNQGYSLVRRKKMGTKFGLPGRRENFPITDLPAA